MPNDGFKERRAATRFSVRLQASYRDSLLLEEPIPAETRDIGASGIGFITNRELPCGLQLNICLRMPDNGEEVKLKGTVIWASPAAAGKYRVGVRLEEPRFKPIPLVLRFIKSNLF